VRVEGAEPLVRLNRERQQQRGDRRLPSRRSTTLIPAAAVNKMNSSPTVSKPR
jgi:hypothetical protein